MIIPVIVGTAKEMAVHLILCVSFFIVRQVVEQGQCINEKSITQTAVSQVQPLSIKSRFSSDKLAISIILPFDRYAIIMTGITISFAGKPRINAIRITPSRPMSFPKGSRKFEQCVNMLMLPIVMFAISHIIRPAGAATLIALPRTNNVRSNSDLIIILPIWGFLYGGSSSIKEDAIPFSIVPERILDTKNVINTPRTITKVNNTADAAYWYEAETPVIKNIVIMAISVGNLPLHGTKLLVIIAIRRSLGESIILHPTTPAALHPNPMHMS